MKLNQRMLIAYEDYKDIFLEELKFTMRNNNLKKFMCNTFLRAFTTDATEKCCKTQYITSVFFDEKTEALSFEITEFKKCSCNKPKIEIFNLTFNLKDIYDLLTISVIENIIKEIQEGLKWFYGLDKPMINSTNSVFLERFMHGF